MQIISFLLYVHSSFIIMNIELKKINLKQKCIILLKIRQVIHLNLFL